MATSASCSAHAERGWLDREVLPVLHELETPGALSAEELIAALAYLEATWMQAQLRAFQTDASYADLEPDESPHALLDGACRYHAGVRVLREMLAGRVDGLLQAA